MKPLSLLYLIRVILGILAGVVCAVYNYFFGFSFTISDLLRGLTIAIAFYLVTYYILKLFFLRRVEAPKKIVSTGIGAYFITWIVIWSLFATMLLYETNIVFAVKGFYDFEIRTFGDAYGSLNGLLWVNSSNGGLSRVQAIRGFLPHGLGGSKLLNKEINIWKETETLPSSLFLKLNVTDITLSYNSTNSILVFGVALWFAIDEASYNTAGSHQLVVRFQNTTKYENGLLVNSPDAQYYFNEFGHNFNFSIAGINDSSRNAFVEIDLGPKFKKVFEAEALTFLRVVKLKCVEIYAETVYGAFSVKIVDIQIFLKGLEH
jgi:hypothetical protein